MVSRKIRKGSAFLMSMIVLAVLSTWAISIYSISGSNLQLAENQRKADSARATAESGQEIVRLWLNYVEIPGDTPAAERFIKIGESLQLAVDTISNITPYATSSQITVPSVVLDSQQGRSFTAEITPSGSNTLQLSVIGTYGSVAKKIGASYNFDTKPHTVFDYGVATKGPLHLSGNIELEGINVSVESDVFIESPGQNEALAIIGNSQIAGNVTITNPDAYVTLQGGKASIGGDTGAAAMDHVKIGEAPPEFPAPDPHHFEHYAVNTVDSSTDTTVDATFDNIRIVAGTNPTFTGQVTLRGIVFIETPNIVTFAGGVTIIGIIIGDGDVADNSGVNQVNFIGNVTSEPVTELPGEEQFAGLQSETGTFLLAPGFHLSFGGSFGTLNGAIAGNGIAFFGDAGGIINGTIINYSNDEMTLSGNNNLSFNRSGSTKIPVGFIQDIVLSYDPESYSEVML
ncbi:MAG TPA: hypothetical protein VMW16_02225 [Sedimentisphaerales bacterium]|nr:hypothetical protein [Sedimentisphaerales bacterium]